MLPRLFGRADCGCFPTLRSSPPPHHNRDMQDEASHEYRKLDAGILALASTNCQEFRLEALLSVEDASQIRALPPSIGRLTSLETLNLYGKR